MLPSNGNNDRSKRAYTTSELDPTASSTHPHLSQLVAQSNINSLSVSQSLSDFLSQGSPGMRQPLPPLHQTEGYGWVWGMRQAMQEIVPDVFLGPFRSVMTNQLEALKKIGISHIVCVRHTTEARFVRPCHPGHFEYLVITTEEDLTSPLIPEIKKVRGFINQALATPGNRVLVHGNTGMTHSAALVVGYVMAEYGVPFAVAVDFVQTKRRCLVINETLSTLMKDFEPIVAAMSVHPRSSELNSLKRGLPEDKSDDDDDDPMDG